AQHDLVLADARYPEAVDVLAGGNHDIRALDRVVEQRLLGLRPRLDQLHGRQPVALLVRVDGLVGGASVDRCRQGSHQQRRHQSEPAHENNPMQRARPRQGSPKRPRSGAARPSLWLRFHTTVTVTVRNPDRRLRSPSRPWPACRRGSPSRAPRGPGPRAPSCPRPRATGPPPPARPRPTCHRPRPRPPTPAAAPPRPPAP